MKENQLLNLPKFGNGIGLHRVAYLCESWLTAAWLNEVDPIRIVGTNGKGSTTAIVSAILQELGFKTGQYISPHLFDFRERISINGKWIATKKLEELIALFSQQQQTYLLEHPGDHFGAYEAISGLAFQYFFEENVQALVLESGIGGRYDPARLMKGNFVGFTSVDLEHTRLLGNTLEEIAYDKLDMAADQSTVVVGDIPEDVFRKLKHYADIRGIELLSIHDFSSPGELRYENDLMVFNLAAHDQEWSGLRTRLAGMHQLNNIRIAILLTRFWIEKRGLSLKETGFHAAVRQALQKLQWPGRLEKVRDYPRIYVDIAHTPDAIHKLVQTLKNAFQSQFIVVFGVSTGRNPMPLLSQLQEVSDGLIITQSYHRNTSALQIARVASFSCQVITPLEAAVDLAIQRARQRQLPILISGSLFLAIEAKAYLMGRAPKELTFF